MFLRNSTGFNPWLLTCFYHYDGLGSVVALSNVNGEIIERYSYDVFGEPTIRDANYEIRDTSLYDNPYLFTGCKNFSPKLEPGGALVYPG